MRPAPLLPMYTCLLHHYSSCTYTSCTITTHVFPQKFQKLKSCKEFVEITGYCTVSQLFHRLQPVTQPNNHPFIIQNEVLGSHSKDKHKNSETLPISLSPLAPRICSHIVSFEPEFLILAFFFFHKPMPFP
jgi:hypothetical protein